VARTKGAERIVLSGLTEADVAELVRLTTGAPGARAEVLAPELFRRADGNPFFVTELVRLIDGERRDSPGAQIADASRSDIPAAVGDVVRQRVRRLPAASQGLLRVAAAIGREFDLDVLGLAAGLGDDELLDALEPAILTRVVTQTSIGGYRFAHALVREALYLDVPPTRAWRLHAAIGDAIESVRAADLAFASSELAYHHGRAAGAGRTEQALRYSCLAAEQAARRLSFDEAADHWRDALALLDRRGGAPDPVQPAERSRLLLQLATALRHAGDLDASVAAQDEALAMAERSGDLDALARAALSYGRVGLWQRREYATVDPRVVGALERLLQARPKGDDPERARLLAGLAVALYYSEAHGERVRALAAEALATARRLGDRDLVGHVFDQVHVMLDRDEQLRTLSELARPAPGEAAVVVDPVAKVRLARLRLTLGDASTLESDVEEAVRAGEDLCDPTLRQFAGWLRTTVAFLQGRLDEAERLAAEARALHDQLGFWGGAELYGFNLVLVRREQGRLAEIAPFLDAMLRRSTYPAVAKVRALSALERGDLPQVRALLAGDPIPRARDFIWSTEMALLAEAAAVAGLPCAEEVYDLLCPASDQVVTMSAYACLGAVSHYLGLLAGSLGRAGDARAHLEDAVALNDRIGAVPWAVRSRFELAALVEPTDPERARRLLTEASASARSHGLVAMDRRIDGALALAPDRAREGGSPDTFAACLHLFDALCVTSGLPRTSPWPIPCGAGGRRS
jgi:tetratricopeptide (TPR) repeat protein